MSKFPWFEAALVLALAVALIVKPPSRVVSAATQNLPPVARIEIGETKKMGDGSVCSWVRVDEKGEPTGIGVTMTEAALNNLLKTGEDETLLHLPANVAVAPFTHIAVKWNGSTKTFLCGAYAGKVAFVEPMVTRAYLLNKPNAVEPIPQPKVYPAGVFPTQYTVKVDRSTHEYTIALEGLKRH